MDVTRGNFTEVLPLVEAAIDEADFMAIDGEFTGISNLKSGNTEHSYDSLEERYQKIYQGSADFLLIQFGLATFKYDQETHQYVAKSFNFNVFPAPFSRQAPDSRFICQASSMDFLASQGFDFNKVFKDGIPYLSWQDEMKMKEKLQYRHEQHMLTSPAFTSPAGAPISGDAVTKTPVEIPDNQKEFITRTIENIDKFLDESSEPHLDLPPCSAFQRKLIYQTAQSKFHSKITLQPVTLQNRQRFIKVIRVTSDTDLAQQEIARQAAEFEELEKAVGFSKVIKKISKSGKLVVGHNMYLDLIHILQQFYVDLPQKYGEFKSVLHCLLPKICDTKLMSSMHPFREHILMNPLPDLQKYLEHKPFSKVILRESDDATSYTVNSDKLHEAGYDAFITGVCFIGMSNYLGSFQSPPKTHVHPDSSVLKPFINKIYVMRITDIPYMDIVGKDLDPPRDNVFHVKIHDKKLWNFTDVKQLFSATGTVNIGWIDDTSVLVGIPRENIELMNPRRNTPNCTITPYSVFKANGQVRPRKRSLEEVDCPLPKSSNNNKTKLNVNAVPFVSRSISPIPEEKSLGLDEDIGEVVVKRQKTDDSNERKTSEAGTSSKSYSEAAKNGASTIVFDVPDEW